jgi:hypothetical protein
MKICRNTLAIAERVDEKKLALEVLNRYPSAASLEIAASAADDGEIRENACQTAINIAEKIVDGNQDAVAKAMAKVAETTKNPQRQAKAKALIARAK